jgi:hypothetical protein
LTSYKLLLSGLCFVYGFGWLNSPALGQTETKPPAIVEEKEFPQYGLVPPNDVINVDGRLIAHLESQPFGDRILIKNVESGENKVLFDSNPKSEVKLGETVLTLLSFSPDSKQFMFMIGGRTWYYPSNIMTIGVDGATLQQLTAATPAKFLTGPADYAVDNARYSPDGHSILLNVRRGNTDGKGDTPAIAMILPGLEKQTPAALTDGEALFWSTNGQSFYYQSADGSIGRMEASTKKNTVVVTGVVHPLGRVPGADAVFVANIKAGHLYVVSLDGSIANHDKMSLAAGISIRDSAGRVLEAVEPVVKNQLMLKYSSNVLKPNFQQVHQELINFQ